MTNDLDHCHRKQRRVSAVCAVLITAAAWVAGCSAPLSATPAEKVQSLFWDLERKLRKPGERLVAQPAAVWKELGCDQRPLPYFVMEKNEILPASIAPGRTFNHRLEYVLCVAGAGDSITGTLTRRIRYKGNVVFKDATNRFELKPGRWRIDATIDTPPGAKAGVYAFEAAFSSDTVNFDHGLSLIIGSAPGGSETALAEAALDGRAEGQRYWR